MRVFKFADNIDTDLIIAARYLNTSDEKILAKYVMEDARTGFFNEIKENDCIVAGENFGCGSSREHAPIALKAANIKCVIAKSFARIFYRNAFNTGLLILECADCDKIDENDEIEIDLNKGEIKNISKKEK
ncbi:3-isopropylmalate dehydratase, partial [Campylobacter canadensis]